jgi:hypothetical protein
MSDAPLPDRPGPYPPPAADLGKVSPAVRKMLKKLHPKIAKQKKRELRRMSRQTAWPIIWYHGGMSYSIDKTRPRNVSREMHNVLRVFLDRKAPRSTRELAASADNVSAVMKKIDAKFPDAVLMPKDKGDGYFIRVRSVR